MPRKHGSHIISSIKRNHRSTSCIVQICWLESPFAPTPQRFNNRWQYVPQVVMLPASKLDCQHPNLMASMTLATYVLASVPEIAEYTIIKPIHFRSAHAKIKMCSRDSLIFKIHRLQMTLACCPAAKDPGLSEMITLRVLLAPLLSCWCVAW